MVAVSPEGLRRQTPSGPAWQATSWPRQRGGKRTGTSGLRSGQACLCSASPSTPSRCWGRCSTFTSTGRCTPGSCKKSISSSRCVVLLMTKIVYLFFFCLSRDTTLGQSSTPMSTFDCTTMPSTGRRAYCLRYFLLSVQNLSLNTSQLLLPGLNAITVFGNIVGANMWAAQLHNEDLVAPMEQASQWSVMPDDDDL